MGTNYYAIEPECPASQQLEWHICKSLRMFEAHEDSPWGTIESWADWKRVLTEREIEIRDEYGALHPVAGFIKDVEATPMKARRHQYQWMVDHGYEVGERDYLDADGFSFHRWDFS